MTLIWKTATITLEDAESGCPPGWEPFAVVEDDEDGTPLCVIRALIEDEGERSSTRPENFNLAGNEPDVLEKEEKRDRSGGTRRKRKNTSRS